MFRSNLSIFLRMDTKEKYINNIAKFVLEEKGETLKSGDESFGKIAEEIIFNDIKNSLKKLGVKFDHFTNEKTFYENGEH